MINIVILGRGGMGAVTACQLIVEAAYLSGNFVDVHAYPSFGAERRGAPIMAFAKLSRTEKIWDRSEIKSPDILIVFDQTVLTQISASSVKKGGIIIINSEKDSEYFRKKFSLNEEIKIVLADINTWATEKGLMIDGIPVVNTAILGLLSKALPELSLENLIKLVQKRMNEKIAKVNIELMEQGYNLAKIL